MNKIVFSFTLVLLSSCSSYPIGESGISNDIVSTIELKFRDHRAFCGEPISYITYCPNKTDRELKTSCYRAYYWKPSSNSYEGIFIEVSVKSGEYTSSNKKIEMPDGKLADVVSGCVR